MTRVPDDRVRVAIDNWGPRLIANGVDYNDFVRTTAAIERWDEWLDAWTATADVHRSLAVQARDAGYLHSAGEAFLRAAVTYHFAKFVWVLDPERNRRATEAAVRCMYDALAILDPGARRIDASAGSLSARPAAGTASWPWRSRPRSVTIAPPPWASTTFSDGWRSMTPDSTMWAAVSVVSIGFPMRLWR